MSKLGTVNFKVFDEDQITGCNNRDEIKKKIIEKLPEQYADFSKQILPYIETYLNNDILDNFFKDTLKTPITKIYSSHNFNVKKAIAFVTTQNNSKIEKILNIINKSEVFTQDNLTDNINRNTDTINIEIKSSLVTSESPFIIALKNYIGNLINLLNLLKDNEETIKNIYALANNQRIKVAEKSSNHKLLPKKSKYYSDTNVTAKQLKDIVDNTTWSINKLKNSLVHFGNDITLNNLKEELKLFQTAYANIEKFINGDNNDSNKYSIKYIKQYIENIKKSQKDLIESLQDINNNFDYTKDIPHYIFKNKIANDNKQEYENILNLLRDITNNEALLEQINDSKKRIKLYLDHSNDERDVEVIDLVEATRNIEIDKQLKAFNNSQFDTETLLTPFNKATSKGLEYLNNIIIIIIFLIFLNLFITTYFYFTTSIQATANRSNCGGASLCEAETHRHLFLEDNGNDKARDIYIIIVVIFSIYLLSEIFKSYKDGIDFRDITSNSIFRKNIVILCFIASVILIELAKFYFVSYDNDYSTDDHPNNHFLWELKRLDGADKIMSNIILGISGVIFLIVGIHLMYNLKQERQYSSTEVYSIYIALFIMLAIILGYDISKVVNSKYYQEKTDPDNQENENDNSKGFESTNFNSKFKAKTAIDIILITFYIISILVFGFGLIQQYKGNNYDITLYIIALSLLAILLVTLYIFILNSSVDWSRPDNTDNYDRYFEFFIPCFIVASGVFPGLLALMFKSEQNIIKLIVFYYAILFIIYLFYVYFINHNNESGILSLAYFQLYNYININKNETTKGSVNTNYYKRFNELNVYFVAILLIILIIIGGLNEDSNLDNIIYGIIVFILASYITGIVYLLYNELFPIQQASFKYKKNLVEINNEISQHIKVEEVEHTIDKNKIRVFKIANDSNELTDIHARIKHPRTDGTTDKEKHMKNIRDIFSEISPKGSSYEDYRSQSIHQMQYEEYINLLFSASNYNIIDNYDHSFYSNLLFQKNSNLLFQEKGQVDYKVSSSIATNKEQLYNQIILNVPNTLRDIDYDIGVKYKDTDYLSNLQFTIPVTNNIEYVIKKNYKYVTGEEGVIQKYNILSNLGSESNSAFYTIGYDYENHTEDHQQMNKDTAYSIPARYYACSYLNYFPNEDGSMSKVKFAKNINEDNYNPLNIKETIIDRISKRYDENAKETKIQLAPEKFQFLLVFLVILAIILLMFLFNIIKKYFTGDVYTPQMYVLGILAVFLTIFIFGEVIFARIK